MHPVLLFITFTLFMISFLDPIQSIKMDAIEFETYNNAKGTPGGKQYEKDIGLLYSDEILDGASLFIWKTFKQHEEKERKHVEKIVLTLESMEGIAYTRYNIIHLSAEYVGNYSGDYLALSREVFGILYHETTHVWQWHGKGDAPSGLIEGIADFVRLKAGWVPAHWVKKGGGDSWDQGYDVTARFLDYCNDLKHGFVASLNFLMKDGYSEEYFVKLLGKTVDVLWNDYKHKYGGLEE